MIEDKENIQINEMIEVCAKFLSDPNDQDNIDSYNDLVQSLIIRTYIPLEQKEILLKKAILDTRTVDDESYHFTTALEIAKLFDILLAYVVNLDININAMWKDYDFYDILYLADIPSHILQIAAEDYYKCEQMVTDALHFDNLKQLLREIKLTSPEEIDRLTQEFKNFTLNTNIDILKEYNNILATDDPLLNAVKDSVTLASLDTSQLNK